MGGSYGNRCHTKQYRSRVLKIEPSNVQKSHIRSSISLYEALYFIFIVEQGINHFLPGPTLSPFDSTGAFRSRSTVEIYSCRHLHGSHILVAEHANRIHYTVKAQTLSLLCCTQGPRTEEKYKNESEITHILVSVLYELVRKVKAMGFDPERENVAITATSKATKTESLLLKKVRNGRASSSKA